MTPIEIFEYKNRWMSKGAFQVKIHSDLRYESTDWCRRYLHQRQWKSVTYTNNYEDTFWFEDQKHSQLFEQEFIDWIIK
jgi:hypothetical protein